ncbi:MAG: NAD(P)-dependent oxidoreductase [Pseudomonadota bacterium]
MRLAITGATGFVGSAVLEEALANLHFVQALTRRPNPRQKLLKERKLAGGEIPRDGVEWVEGTLDEMGALRELCDGMDAVIHIAGLTNTPDIAQFETANVKGTANVIEAAKRAKVRKFVFVSSLSARKPELSAYGASKALAEELVKASKLDWTIVRPPAVYGPRDVDMFELFRSAKMGVVPLPPAGATSIIHVKDLAELLIALSDTMPLKGPSPIIRKVYEPDDGREGGWSHKELARAIGKAMGRARVFAPHLPANALTIAAKADKRLRGDKAKLTADRVGYMCHPNWVSRSDRAVPYDIWEPQISGEEGLKQTAEWYRAEGWL